jgi:hypothetical protein
MHFGTVVHKNLKEDINTTINFIWGTKKKGFKTPMFPEGWKNNKHIYFKSYLFYQCQDSYQIKYSLARILLANDGVSGPNCLPAR